MEQWNLEKLAKEKWWLVASHGVFSGVLYLLGYWSAFKVNILQYAGISDLIYSTVFPMAVLVSLMLATFVLMMTGPFLAVLYEDATSRGIKKFGPPKPTRFDRLYYNHGGEICIVFVLAALHLAFSDYSFKWQVIPPLIGVTTVMLIRESDWFRYRTRSRGLFLFAMIFFVNIPLVSFSTGRNEADMVLEGSKFQYVLSEISGVTPPGGDVKSYPRFLGHVGDYDFVLEIKRGAIAIIKTTDERPLLIKAYRDKPPELNWDLVKRVRDEIGRAVQHSCRTLNWSCGGARLD